MKTPLLRSLLGLSLLLGSLSVAQADAYHVTLDTSSLFANPGNAPFQIDWQLIDGDGVANNSVSLTHFLFGGGSAGGSPTLKGGASGDLSSGVTLTDPDPGFIFNALLEGFTPGSTLSFDLFFTSQFSGSGSPDRFTFAVRDKDGEITTTGPFNELLGIDLTGLNPTVEVYSLAGSYSGGLTVTAIPELPRLAWPVFGLLFVGLVKRRRGREGES